MGAPDQIRSLNPSLAPGDADPPRCAVEDWGAHAAAIAGSALVAFAVVSTPAEGRHRVDSASASALAAGDLSEAGFRQLTRDNPTAARLAEALYPFPGAAERAARAAALFRAAAPLTAEALRFAGVTEDEARALNAAIPFSTLPNAAAKPFRLGAVGGLDETRAVECLTAAIYYEAGFEPTAGQRAVAQVVLNRVRHPAYPKTVCGVVFQGSNLRTGCQFSFTCDGSLSREPVAAAWRRSRAVAVAAFDGAVARAVGNATHYHADYVAPYWSGDLVKLAKVGAHIFYRWTGGRGLPPAFRAAYRGGEPSVGLAGALEPPPPTQIDPAPVVTAAPLEEARDQAIAAPTAVVVDAPTEFAEAAAPPDEVIVTAEAASPP